MTGITDEVRRAGWDAFVAAIEGGYDSPQVYAQTLEAIVSAFVAGRAVVDLPEPDEVDAESTGYWGDVYTGDFVSSRPPNGEVGDFLCGVTLGRLIRTGGLKPERAEQVAGWILAAARHARQSTISPEVAGGVL